MWGIIDSLGNHQGNISFYLTPRHDSGYFQIYIGNKENRGKGLGRRALELLFEHYFGTGRVHRIWLHLSKENKVAENLYKSLGFTLEGIERESIKRGNTYHDQQRFSLLKQEWENRERRK